MHCLAAQQKRHVPAWQRKQCSLTLAVQPFRSPLQLTAWHLKPLLQCARDVAQGSNAHALERCSTQPSPTSRLEISLACEGLSSGADWGLKVPAGAAAAAVRASGRCEAGAARSGQAPDRRKTPTQSANNTSDDFAVPLRAPSRGMARFRGALLQHLPRAGSAAHQRSPAACKGNHRHK